MDMTPGLRLIMDCDTWVPLLTVVEDIMLMLLVARVPSGSANMTLMRCPELGGNCSGTAGGRQYVKTVI